MTDIFKAIADPSRRQILSLLLVTNALSMQEIYTRFDASRQAVTKHIKVLSEAGLIQIKNERKGRMCYLHAAKLKEVSDWVKIYEHFWDEKLEALGKFLDKTYPTDQIG